MSRRHNDFVDLDAIPPAQEEGGASRRTLSVDDGTGAETCVLTAPAGWRMDLTGTPGSLEVLVLDGEIALGGDPLPREGWARVPAAGSARELSAATEARVLLMTDPSAAPEGEPAVRDVREMAWQRGVRGGPGGIAVKTLYEGSTVSLMIANVPRYGSGAEFHECPEELFVIGGDVTGRHGTMTAGSYFWRPEYITHGPYWSETGLLTFVRGHGDIYAHWIEDPDATVEQNRAYAATLAQPRETEAR